MDYECVSIHSSVNKIYEKIKSIKELFVTFREVMHKLKRLYLTFAHAIQFLLHV